MNRKRSSISPAPSLETHYPVREAARRMGISKSAVYALMKLGEKTKGREGIYPWAHPFGDVRVIPESAIKRHMDRCTVRPLGSIS